MSVLASHCEERPAEARVDEKKKRSHRSLEVGFVSSLDLRVERQLLRERVGELRRCVTQATLFAKSDSSLEQASLYALAPQSRLSQISCVLLSTSLQRVADSSSQVPACQHYQPPVQSSSVPFSSLPHS